MTRGTEIIDWWQWRNIYMPRQMEIPAKDILDKISSGKRIEYDSVVITGDLVPQTLRFNYVFAPIIIKNSTIRGKVSFKDVQFNGAVDFRGTSFEDEVNFIGAIYGQQCIFEGAHFQKPTYFGGDDPRKDRPALFIGQSNFKKTIFEKYANFNNVEFIQIAEFGCQNHQESFNNRSIFKGHTIFIGAKFKSIAHFEACEFQDVQFGVEFRGSVFKKEAYFQGATFSGYANFLNTIFEEYTDFSNTNFSSQTNGVGFAEANFRGYVTDFRNAIFNGSFANFRATQFTGEFVSFKDAKFRNLTDQERACRKARTQLNKNANRIEEDYMFYAEMDARRRKKGITKTPYPESQKRVEWGAMSKYEFIDYFKYALRNHEWSKIKGFFLHNLLGNLVLRHLFGGYGIFWYQIAFWWLFISMIIGFYYWIFQGIVGAPCLRQCIYFSFLVAFTRGYGDFYPKPDFELLATSETIFGLIMFGIFIAAITRKYMR